MKKENTYSQVVKVDERSIDRLILLGFLKSTFKCNVAIYEAYLSYREKGIPSTDARVFTADDFHISDRHVFSIIRKFSEILETP